MPDFKPFSPLVSELQELVEILAPPLRFRLIVPIHQPETHLSLDVYQGHKRLTIGVERGCSQCLVVVHGEVAHPTPHPREHAPPGVDDEVAGLNRHLGDVSFDDVGRQAMGRTAQERERSLVVCWHLIYEILLAHSKIRLRSNIRERAGRRKQKPVRGSPATPRFNPLPHPHGPEASYSGSHGSLSANRELGYSTPPICTTRYCLPSCM